MSICSDISYMTSDSMLGGTLDSSGKPPMHWKLFRKDVLAPHHIRVLETNYSLQLPDAVIEMVKTNCDNVTRFTKQRQHFRRHVAEGRGFGESALFLHEVLPWTKGQPFIAKCMVPTFSTESLPERKVRDDSGSPGLSSPQPALACGFSTSAFGPEELRSIPDFLETPGTTLDFESGSITPDAALYCPFMTFERTLDQQYGLENAENYCAINGAWAIRSIQMLYAKVSSSLVQKPVSFTCAIDNTVAILNYHWVDHAHTYCMAPLIKFELSRDDHFNQFLIWMEAIGSWAVSSILPEIKKVIDLLAEDSSQDLALINPLKVSQNTTSLNEQSVLSALQLSYPHVSWRLEDNISAASSSTASCGSPIIDEVVFSNIKCPVGVQHSHKMPINQLDTSNTTPISCSDLQITRNFPLDASTSRTESKSTTPEVPSVKAEVAFETNTELLLKRRLSHAMDEIEDLHGQLTSLKAELSSSTMRLQDEPSVPTKSMNFRKEGVGFKQRSIRNVPHRLDMSRSKNGTKFEKEASVITTPTDPSARPMWQRAKSVPRWPSGLQNVLALDTKVSASVTTRQAVGNTQPLPSTNVTTFSPTITKASSNEAWGESMEGSDDENCDAPVRATPRSNSWSPALTAHLFCAFVPSILLRILFLGFLVDYWIVSMSGHQAQSLSHYLSHILESGISV